MVDFFNRDITFIGFSLTGYGDDSSYGRLLEDRLKKTPWRGQVREVSYGGLSVNALAGLMKEATASVQSNDVVALEIATSFFSLQGYKLSDALPYVFAITKELVERKDVDIFFLNLYRSELDDNDSVVQAINIVAEYFSIRVLDLKSQFRISGDFKTVDGVHPDLNTRNLVATEIEGFLSQHKFVPLANVGVNGPSYKLVNFSSFPTGLESYTYQGRGKQMISLILLPEKEVEIDLGNKMEIDGFCFLYGPETGYVEVDVDGEGMTELVTHDEFSYYRRVGTRPLRRHGRILTIRTPAKRRDVKLLKSPDGKVASRREFISGVIVKDDTFSLPAEILPTLSRDRIVQTDNKNQEFDSASYWRARHEQYRFDKKGVGNVSLTSEENERIYRAAAAYVTKVAAHVTPVKRPRVLDLGCGIGMLADAFVKLGYEYVGIDVSDTAVEIAKLNNPHAQFLNASIVDIPLEPGFDIIMERTVFIHLIEDSVWNSALDEVKRLLSVNGVFILIDQLPLDDSEELGKNAPHVKFRKYSQYSEALGERSMKFDLEKRSILGEKMVLSPHTHLICHS